MVGPRVANHVLHTLHDAFPDRFPLSPTLENFANGEMDVVLTGDDRRSEDEIYQRILEALADEARHVLDEGVVASAGEIDACLILGAGFPFFRGGPDAVPRCRRGFRRGFRDARSEVRNDFRRPIDSGTVVPTAPLRARNA